MSKQLYKGRFDGIQALRALAAFSVLVNHMAFIQNGGFGVDIFFCISGFIMMYVTNDSTQGFIQKRLIRIVPLYYIMTLFTYISALILPSLFEQTTMSPVYLIKSLLFIPFDIGNAIQPIVRVGWTLNYEVFFYVILWVSLHISHRFRGVIASIILASLTVVGMTTYGMYDFATFWTDSIIIEFIYGMIAYDIVSRIAEAVYNKKFNSIIYIIVAVLCFCFMWSVKYIDALSNVPRFVVYGIPALLLFVMIFLATYKVKLPRVIVFLGDISYSVYLIHYFIVRIFNQFICPDNMIDFAAIVGGLGVIVLTIAISSASYLIIEKKVGSLLRHFFT